MKKFISSFCFVILGLALLIIGVYLIKTLQNPQKTMQALPYVCIGLGCGIFGHGMGNIINQLAVKNNPDIAKQIEIEKKDERNVTIANRAKAKAYDLMLFVFGALILAFTLMDIDIATILILLFSYLFIIGCGFYYRYKYNKEM